MTAAATTARTASDVLHLGRRVAAELAGEAIDLTASLSMADRFALAALAIAVDVEASRRASVEPLTVEALPQLAAELAAIERVAIPIHPVPLRAAG